MDPASAFSFDMSYCGLPPVPDNLWARWNFDPVLIALLIVIGIVGVWFLRREKASRMMAFLTAWTIAAVLFLSPLCALSVALFSARVGHHVALTMVVAPLLAMALPLEIGRKLRLLPPLAISTIALWMWHSPDLYATAFAHPAVYWLMQIALLSSFTWLWAGLIHSQAPLGAGIAALSSAIQMGLLGALLVFAPQPLYAPHLTTTFAFGITPLDDQQIAGLIMWVPANLPLMVVVLWRLMSILQPAGETVRQ